MSLRTKTKKKQNKWLENKNILGARVQIPFRRSIKLWFSLKYDINIEIMTYYMDLGQLEITRKTRDPGYGLH